MGEIYFSPKKDLKLHKLKKEALFCRTVRVCQDSTGEQLMLQHLTRVAYHSICVGELWSYISSLFVMLFHSFRSTSG